MSLIQSLTNTLHANSENIMTTIQAEVTAQRDLAKNRIGPVQVAREYANRHLLSMPGVVTGTFMSDYLDDREQAQTKEQSKNTVLWLIALQSTIESSGSSISSLKGLFGNFATETMGKVWAEEPLLATCKAFFTQLIELGIINKLATDTPYIDAEGNEQVSKLWALTDEFKATLEPIKAELIERTSMVCKPLKNVPTDWTNAFTGIGEDANIKLISNSKLNKNDKIEQAVLDAVNKLQHVEFIVSPVIIKEAFNTLANLKGDITPEERSMYVEVMQYKKGSYHFPVTMDNRGRMYYRGGILTPQGTDFCKAAFQFAEYVPLGNDGIEGIAIHTANVLGFDKLSIDSRIDLLTSWHDSHTFDDIKNTKTLLAKFPSASKFQGLVAVMECKRLFKALEADIELEAFESNLVCHQDGTCNGLQHMAAITGDRSTAEAVNCTAASTADLPTDIYGLVADAAHSVAKNKDTADLITKYGRDMSKNPVMITGYGAGEDTVKTNTAAYLAKKEGSSKHGLDCGQAYLDAIGTVASAVHNLTNILKINVGFAIDEGQRTFDWITADGFIARTEYNDKEGNRVRAGGFSALVPAMNNSVFDDVKTKGAMAPNFIHSIDSTHLRMTVNACNHDLVTVHDSVGSHAGNYWATSVAIREQFVAVHDYDAVENLCDHMGQMVPEFDGDYQAKEALNAPYIFS